MGGHPWHIPAKGMGETPSRALLGNWTGHILPCAVDTAAKMDRKGEKRKPSRRIASILRDGFMVFG